MERTRRRLKKKLLTTTISFCLLLLFLFVALESRSKLDHEKATYLANAKDMIAYRMDSLAVESSIIPPSAEADVKFISHLSSVVNYLNGSGSEKSLHEDFKAFLKQKPDYVRLKLLSSSGFKVMCSESNCTSSNGSNEDFLKAAGKHNLDEVHISSTNNSDNIKIIISTLVVNSLGQRIGVLVISTESIGILTENIKLASREGDALFLIKSNGQYVTGPRSAFITGATIYNDYPEFPRDTLASVKTSKEDRDFIFSLKPLTSLGLNSKSIIQGNDSLFIVTVSNKTQLENVIKKYDKSYTYYMLFFGITVAMILVLTMLLGSLNVEVNKNG
jgi:hypothetical protein